MTEFLTQADRQRHRRRRRIKIALWGIGILALMGGITYVVFVSSLFRLKWIEVSGTQYTSQTQIQNILVGTIPQISYAARILGTTHFFVWTDDIPNLLLAALPALEKVDIGKDYIKKKIQVDVVEREREGIWCAVQSNVVEGSEEVISNERCFWFDKTGFLFESSPAAEGSLVLAVYDYSARDIDIGNHVLTPEQFSSARAVFTLLDDLEISINQIKILRPELHELIVTTYDGPELRFSLDFSPAIFKEPLQKLKSGSTFRNLRYIDLRVENRVYYQ